MSGFLPRKPHPTACFSVVARAEPGTLPRVLALFAKRGLVPSSLHASFDGPSDHDITIDVQVKDMEPALATYIAQCMRQIFEVECVLTSEKRYAETA